jgi:hypothetical protein
MPIKNTNIGKYKLPWCDYSDYSYLNLPQRKRMVTGLGYVLTPPTPVYNQDSKEEIERKEKLLNKIQGYKGRIIYK